MAKIAKGILSGAVNFIIVGVVVPFLIEYFSGTISRYVPLPSATEIWGVFIAFGLAFGLTGFLQGAYSKGEYPWLAGKLGSAVTNVAFYTFVFSLVPKSTGAAGGTIQTSNLLYLIYLAIILSYAYLILDFYDARRRNAAAAQSSPVSAVPVSTPPGS